MPSRRLDINSLLCHDSRSSPSPHNAPSPPPPHHHTPASTSPRQYTMRSPQLVQSGQSPPYLGLDALVHAAAEERRRLSNGSSSETLPDDQHRRFDITRSPQYQPLPTTPRLHHDPYVRSPQQVFHPRPISFEHQQQQQQQQHHHSQPQPQPIRQQLYHHERRVSDESRVRLSPVDSFSQRPSPSPYILPLSSPRSRFEEEQLQRQMQTRQRQHEQMLQDEQLYHHHQLHLQQQQQPQHHESHHQQILQERQYLRNLHQRQEIQQQHLQELALRRISPPSPMQQIELSPRSPLPSTSARRPDPLLFPSPPVAQMKDDESTRPIKKQRYSISPVRSTVSTTPMHIPEVTDRLARERDKMVFGELGYGRVISPVTPQLLSTSAPSLAPISAAPRRPGSGGGRRIMAVADLVTGGAEREPPSSSGLFGDVSKDRSKEKEVHRLPSSVGRRSPPGSAAGRAKAARKIVDEGTKTMLENDKQDGLGLDKREAVVGRRDLGFATLLSSPTVEKVTESVSVPVDQVRNTPETTTQIKEENRSSLNRLLDVQIEERRMVEVRVEDPTLEQRARTRQDIRHLSPARTSNSENQVDSHSQLKDDKSLATKSRPRTSDSFKIPEPKTVAHIPSRGSLQYKRHEGLVQKTPENACLQAKKEEEEEEEDAHEWFLEHWQDPAPERPPSVPNRSTAQSGSAGPSDPPGTVQLERNKSPNLLQAKSPLSPNPKDVVQEVSVPTSNNTVQIEEVDTLKSEVTIAHEEELDATGALEQELEDAAALEQEIQDAAALERELEESAALEQELEALISAPGTTSKPELPTQMDVDVDQAVAELVEETLGGDPAKDDDKTKTQQFHSRTKALEVEVEDELLSLVDDCHPQSASLRRNPLKPSALRIEDEGTHTIAPLGPVSIATTSSAPISPAVRPSSARSPSERASMPPPSMHAIVAKDKEESKKNERLGNVTASVPVSTAKKKDKEKEKEKEREKDKDTEREKDTLKDKDSNAKLAAKTKSKSSNATSIKPRTVKSTGTKTKKSTEVVPTKNVKAPAPPTSVRKNTSRSRSASAMPVDAAGLSSKDDVEKQEEEEDEGPENEDDKLYCVCKTRYDEDRFMIACDRCDEWYHTQCVDMPDLEVDLVDQFICPPCVEKNPHLSLRTTYKTRCLFGLKHADPDSSRACHRPARGAFSKYCSDECGVRYMQMRIDAWARKGGKRDKLWESIRGAERREGVVVCAQEVAVCQLDKPALKPIPKSEGDGSLHVKMDGEGCKQKGNGVDHNIKTHIKPNIGNKSPTIQEVTPHVRKGEPGHRPKRERVEREAERLRGLLDQIVKSREEIKKGLEVVVWRERLLELASERAESIGQCGWDQRLCFGDEEWADFGAGVLESYEEVKAENKDEENGTDMPVDLENEGEGEWWCPGKKICDRHAGWQAVRFKDVCKEKEKKEEALLKLTTREREIRKRIEDITDPLGRNPKVTSAPSPLKPANSKHLKGRIMSDSLKRGKKRKNIFS